MRVLSLVSMLALLTVSSAVAQRPQPAASVSVGPAWLLEPVGPWSDRKPAWRTALAMSASVGVGIRDRAALRAQATIPANGDIPEIMLMFGGMVRPIRALKLGFAAGPVFYQDVVPILVSCPPGRTSCFSSYNIAMGHVGAGYEVSLGLARISDAKAELTMDVAFASTVGGTIRGGEPVDFDYRMLRVGFGVGLR